MTASVLQTDPKKSQAYRNFFDSIKSAKTKRNYDFYLNKYMSWHGIKSYDSLLKGSTKEIENKIIKWVVEDKSISNTSKTVYLGGLKHFYFMNRKQLNWKFIQKYVGEKEGMHQDRAYSEDELLKMFNIANLREKMVLTLMASSFIRRQAVAEIRLKHLEKIDKYGIYAITIYAGTKYEYKARCSRECRKYIEEYLVFRQARGEKLTPESPLLREEFDINDTLRAANPKNLTEHSIVDMMRSLANRAGIRQTTHLVEGQNIPTAKLRKEVMLTHGLRKFGNTQMVKAKVYPITKELLLGHAVGLDKHYLRPSDEDITEEYMKVEPLVTIDLKSKLEQQVQQLQSEKANVMDWLYRNKDKLDKMLIGQAITTAAMVSLPLDKNIDSPSESA